MTGKPRGTVIVRLLVARTEVPAVVLARRDWATGDRGAAGTAQFNRYARRRCYRPAERPTGNQTSQPAAAAALCGGGGGPIRSISAVPLCECPTAPMPIRVRNPIVVVVSDRVHSPSLYSRAKRRAQYIHHSQLARTHSVRRGFFF